MSTTTKAEKVQAIKNHLIQHPHTGFTYRQLAEVTTPPVDHDYAAILLGLATKDIADEKLGFVVKTRDTYRDPIRVKFMPATQPSTTKKTRWR